MGLRITGNTGIIEKNLNRAQKDAQASLERLSSGTRFTRSDSQPAERAISDSLNRKLRDVQTHKRNASEGISLVDTADSALNEESNISLRLKELATQATNPGLSDHERRFLFVEYQGLYKEMERIAKTTDYNGQPLLAGTANDGKERSIQFLVGDPQTALDSNGETLNRISLKNLEQVDATPQSLGLIDASSLLENGEDGVSIEDVEELFESSSSTVSDSFSGALDRIGEYRAQFGAVGSRLNFAMDVLAVKGENIQAAQSAIRDVDYATEVTNLTRANILVQASAALMIQANMPAKAALTLVQKLDP
jgi:flagellin